MVLLSQVIDDDGRPSRVIVSLWSFLIKAWLAMPPFCSVGINPGRRDSLAFFSSTVLPNGRCPRAGSGKSWRGRWCRRRGGFCIDNRVRIIQMACAVTDVNSTSRVRVIKDGRHDLELQINTACRQEVRSCCTESAVLNNFSLKHPGVQDIEGLIACCWTNQPVYIVETWFLARIPTNRYLKGSCPKTKRATMWPPTFNFPV